MNATRNCEETPNPADPVRERFWSKVEKTESCWFWTDALSHGYGTFWNGERSVRVHRYAWEELRGEIPKGLVIDHLCRNRHCVNPDHLEPVTDRVNVLRGVGITAINATKTHCIHGHEFTRENTRMVPGKSDIPERLCVLCRRESQHQFDLRRRDKPERKAMFARIARLRKEAKNAE